MFGISSGLKNVYNIFQSPIKNNSEYQAKVHVWKTDWDTSRCGHCSITVSKTDRLGTTKSNHLGFWPKHQGLANPFTLPFPLPAKVVHKLEEDCDHEGDVDNSGTVTPLSPDITYTVSLNKEQYQAMKSKICSEKEKIRDGAITYSLFSRCNFLAIAKLMSKPTFYQNFSANQFCGSTMENFHFEDTLSSIKNIHLENCTTEVAKILREGNIDIAESETLPWGITPAELGKQLVKKTEKVFVQNFSS
ncbi:MAG: hypothetical protein H7A37_10030 [Chlamydiales bacterium]|nr:hypothetical protein [Chlamydiales bacterium]